MISVPGVGERLVPKFVETTSPQRARAGDRSMARFADPSRMPADRLSEAIGEVEARDARPYANDAFLSSLRGLMRTYFDPGPQRPWKLAERCGGADPAHLWAPRSAGRLSNGASSNEAFPERPRGGSPGQRACGPDGAPGVRRSGLGSLHRADSQRLVAVSPALCTVELSGRLDYFG